LDKTARVALATQQKLRSEHLTVEQDQTPSVSIFLGMNSRFSVAVRILTLLASSPEERLTSELIAVSVGTNPVVIRRQLSALRKADLVDPKGARKDGWELTRKPTKIRLREVKSALGEEGLRISCGIN